MTRYADTGEALRRVPKRSGKKSRMTSKVSLCLKGGGRHAPSLVAVVSVGRSLLPSLSNAGATTV